MSDADFPQFTRWVHDALIHLHDSPTLQSHPLVTVLIVESAGLVERGRELRQLLYRAIHTLHPDSPATVQTPDRRAYRLLELRFVEGLSTQEAMQQLGIGKSQFYAKQNEVITTLATLLWAQRRVDYPGTESDRPADEAQREQLVFEESQRLAARATKETVDLTELFASIQPMLSALATTHRVTLEMNMPTTFTTAYSDRVLSRQALLQVVGYAVKIAEGGSVQVRGFQEPQSVGVEIIAQPVELQQELRESIPHIGLETSQRLMTTMNGTLSVRDTLPEAWRASIRWPSIDTPTILVVDDNEGVIDLFRRYLADQSWQVIGAVDGRAARQLLATHHPTVISLDIMLPQEDGWELLTAFRSNDNTVQIPILVCSAFDEPQLALALGATAYLAKPVSQTALLHALKPWTPTGATQR